MSDVTAGKPVEVPAEPPSEATPRSVPEVGPADQNGSSGSTAPERADSGLSALSGEEDSTGSDGREAAPGSQADGQGQGQRRGRRRGSRGGRGRSRPPSGGGAGARADQGSVDGAVPDGPEVGTAPIPAAPPLGRVAGEKPKIGDTRPARAPVPPVTPASRPAPGGQPRPDAPGRARQASGARSTARSDGRGEPRTEGRRGGRERRGKAVGRYMICVHVRPEMTQIALLEGRTLVEHYISRVTDDTTQIDGNIYRGRVQNVLPGMEAAFIDIGTPKNAVLYHGDVRYDTDDVESQGTSGQPRIEQLLRPGQSILCQVTKNPIGAKGARLTQEVSLPGRFVVLVPNSTAYGISKRLDDAERRRLRRIVDAIRPEAHGLIVRTAAAGASAEELGADVDRLTRQWGEIATRSTQGQGPQLLYREPAIAVRVIREELNREYRAVVIDDLDLYEQVRDYVEAVNPELAERVEYFDPVTENLPVFERYHVHEQLHKALDRKVYLPSGGSLVIDRTEALTVIDVNTGKNVGTTNLEETVYRNNLEAAEEVARQLRLRDIGGIIVIDFIDMEIRENRDKVGAGLRSALARDKTRTQVFDISELGLVEMTRKRVSEGLIESMSTTCVVCGGRGIVFEDPEE
jgi:ribonuclease E